MKSYFWTNEEILLRTKGIVSVLIYRFKQIAKLFPGTAATIFSTIVFNKSNLSGGSSCLFIHNV